MKAFKQEKMRERWVSMLNGDFQSTFPGENLESIDTCALGMKANSKK